MLRIGICDDEISSRDSLRFALEKILNEDTEKIVYEFSSGKSAVNWVKSHPGELDLLFLDIEMKPLDGMSVAKEIRGFNSTILLVFVTGYTNYVFEGYKVDAMDYLVKPVSVSALQALLERIRKMMHANETTYFTCKNVDGTYRINQKDILYFYSEKRLVYLVTAEKEIPFYDKLDNITEQLEAYFVRIHQRYLVNGKQVIHIGSSSICVNNIELPLSRSQKQTATNQLAKIIMGDII